MKVTVKVTSDFICPWCLIGERRLAKAIDSLPAGSEVDIVWQPFELNPTMPEAGLDRRSYRANKFGSWQYSQMLDQGTVKAAEHDDVAFDYDAIDKTPNTFKAHRLMWLADQQGLAQPLADALFAGYFEQGLDIGDSAVLAELGEKVGLDRAEVLVFLASNQGKGEVRAAEDALTDAGVSGVPLFEIGEQRISGAQSQATLTAALQAAMASCQDGFCTQG